MSTARKPSAPARGMPRRRRRKPSEAKEGQRGECRYPRSGYAPPESCDNRNKYNNFKYNRQCLFDTFADRHIGVSNPDELKAMLDTIGVGSVDELIAQVIPPVDPAEKTARPACGHERIRIAAHIRALADRNHPLRSFIGMGYYPCAVPAAVARATSSRIPRGTPPTPLPGRNLAGRLEALLNFQTAVLAHGHGDRQLLALGRGTATGRGDAHDVPLPRRGEEGRSSSSTATSSRRRSTCCSRAASRSASSSSSTTTTATSSRAKSSVLSCSIRPPTAVRDHAAFVEAAHARCEVTAVADLLAGTAESSRRMGRRHLRRLGATPGHAHRLPARTRATWPRARPYKRQMPGRIIGVSGRPAGNRALRMALQIASSISTRARHLEHLHRLGADGLDGGLLLPSTTAPKGCRAAETAHTAAIDTARAPRRWATNSRTSTSSIRSTSRPKRPSSSRSLSNGHQLLLPLRGARAPLVRRGDHPRRGGRGRGPLRRGAGTQTQSRQEPRPEHAARKRCAAPRRSSPREVFRSHRSESALMRYIKRLEHRDISLADSMISLGSCTMKLNAAASCNPCRWPGSRTCTPSHPSNRPKVTWS